MNRVEEVDLDDAVRMQGSPYSGNQYSGGAGERDYGHGGYSGSNYDNEVRPMPTRGGLKNSGFLDRFERGPDPNQRSYRPAPQSNYQQNYSYQQNRNATSPSRGYQQPQKQQYGGGGGGGVIEEDRDDGQIREKRDEYHEKVLTMEKCHGKCGSYTHEDGTHYIGDFNEEGIKCGMGHMELCNGAIYDGQFQKGLPNGVGVMKFTDGSKYEGEFMQGWFHGHGAFYTIDKMRFEGEFRGGRIWGNGLITYPDETPGIEGYFQDARFARERPCKDTVKKAKKIAKHAVNLYRATNWET